MMSPRVPQKDTHVYNQDAKDQGSEISGNWEMGPQTPRKDWVIRIEIYRESIGRPKTTKRGTSGWCSPRKRQSDYEPHTSRGGFGARLDAAWCVLDTAWRALPIFDFVILQFCRFNDDIQLKESENNKKTLKGETQGRGVTQPFAQSLKSWRKNTSGK